MTDIDTRLEAYCLFGWKSDEVLGVKVEDLTRFAGDGHKGSKATEGNFVSIGEGIFDISEKAINDTSNIGSRMSGTCCNSAYDLALIHIKQELVFIVC